MSQSKKIIINTAYLYLQRILAAVLSLVTTPLILNNLGVEDFGIYTLTIGVVTLLGFLNLSLSTATQRYISFSIGENNLEKSRKAFFSSLLIHALYALLFSVVILIFYFLGVEKFLNIPADKVVKTGHLLLILAFITFFNILQVPFRGLVKAHERFRFFSVMGTFESVYKLVVAFSLTLIVFMDKLIYFGICMAFITLVVLLAYVKYTTKFKELTFQKVYFDKHLIYEMLSFIGWSLIGALAIMGRNQGVSVVINIFFGIIKNAAYGIALQVYAAVTILSQAISTALNPILVKSAGEGNHKKMLYMMESMSKFTFISVSLFGIPLIIMMPFFLKLWLGDFPEDTIIFSRLIVVSGLVMLLSAGVKSVYFALREVKIYNIVVSLILIFNLPISALFFYLGAPAYTIILVGIVLELCSFVFCHYLLQRYVDFDAFAFLKKKLTHLLLPLVGSFFIILILNELIFSKFYYGFVLMAVVFSMIYAYLTYAYSLDGNQKVIVNSYLTKLKRYFT